MAGVSPTALGNEPAFRILWSPVQPGTDPLFLRIIGLDVRLPILGGKKSTFVCLERVLLVIGCEFYDQCGNSGGGKNDVRVGEGCVGL